jgi:hypothetical protein
MAELQGSPRPGRGVRIVIVERLASLMKPGVRAAASFE